MIEESIDKIVEKGNAKDMHDLSDMMIDILKEIKKYNEDSYCKYKMELYIKANGKILNESMAKDIIQNMQPYGMKWTLQQTEDVRKQNSLNTIRPIDFWIVMNMAYNDYHDIFNEDLPMYVKYSKAFILDEDAKEDKVFTYFTEIPK